jgi:hypothetical protein
MDILHLEEQLKQIEFGGQTLNIDERLQLKLSLNKFQFESKLDELLFWGKIYGAIINRTQKRLLHCSGDQL